MGKLCTNETNISRCIGSEDTGRVVADKHKDILMYIYIYIYIRSLQFILGMTSAW